MNLTEKVYHIYAKDRCLYHSLSKEKFDELWETIHIMIELLDGNVRKEELSYEEVTVNRFISTNSSY
jgi:hypothetical protein